MRGVSRDTIFEDAIDVKMDELRMNIRDLLANKLAIKRTSDKNLVDQQDIKVLK